jgi:hypothetical protein
VVGKCIILDLQNCQIELFGFADDWELDLWSFELNPDQEDTIRVNLFLTHIQVTTTSLMLHVDSAV